MIEAVNSVILSAPLVRGVAEQSSEAAVVKAEQQAQEASVPSAPRAPYISPYIFVDVQYDKAVLQIRDSDTGDVVRQFPSESALQSRQRAQAVEISSEPAPTPTGQRSGSSSSTSRVAFVLPEPPVAAPKPVQNAQAQVAAAALAASAQVGLTSGATVNTSA